MPKITNFLISLFLMALAGCSTDKAVNPVAVSDKIVKDAPPDGLLQLCEGVAYHRLTTVRDIVTDRQNYKKAFCDCSERQSALVGWYQNKNLKNACE